MLSNILPNITNPPTANLAPSLVTYLKTLPDVTAYFLTLDSYRRRDFSDRQLPGINIYLKTSEYSSELAWFDGDLGIELILPPVLTREDVALHSTYATDLLSLILSTLTMMEALVLTNPGLTDLGSRLKWAYKKAIGLGDSEKVDAYIIEGTINFRINLLNYYEEIQTGVIYDQSSVVVDPC